MVSLIWAMSENRVIGKDNELPWRLSGDLSHFKRLTLGKPILMGRNTWESLPGLLPKRPHYVVTRDRNYHAAGCTLVHSINEAMTLLADAPEIMVVGGADLYRQMLPYADRLYVTLVHAKVAGDARFPEFDLSDWREVGRSDFPADEKNEFPYSFVEYVRETA
jgi:dihydrofolate reductase